MKYIAQTVFWFLIINLSTYAQQLSSGEYFFGSDPGQGNGTAFTFATTDSVNLAININIGSLPPGYHNLKLRTKNTSGIWSHYETRLFYVVEAWTQQITQPALQQGEYFFNTDPGFGNGTSFTFSPADSVGMIANISTTGLNTGFHNLYIRVKNTGGKWSHYEKRMFYIIEAGTLPVNQPSLVSGEYFFDTDPGFGNGTLISFSASDSVNTAINISTTGLSNGTHHVYLRTKNQNVKWSHYERHQFQICTSVINGMANIYTQSGMSYVCDGHSETFLANLQNEGSSPIFEWKLNGLVVSSASSYTSGTNLATGDELILAVISSANCVSPNPLRDTVTITVNPLPSSAGTISGNTSVCQGQNSVTYTVPTIANATSYLWTLPSGATGTSTTNNITVNYSTSAVSGGIEVYGQNSCGNGAISTLAITINALPTTPTISLAGNILHSDTPLGNQWYSQNGLINGATSQDYTATYDGDYYVIVTLLGCSSEASNTINVILTGIEVVDNDLTIKVYPNPVSNELIIEIDGNNIKINFEILNSIGQVVFKGNFIEKTTVQTNNFATGIYLIKLENGKTFEFKKIIKE